MADLTALAVVIALPYQTIGAQLEVTLFAVLGTSIGWAASVLTFAIVVAINQQQDDLPWALSASNAILYTSFLVQIWCNGYIKAKFPGYLFFSLSVLLCDYTAFNTHARFFVPPLRYWEQSRGQTLDSQRHLIQ